MKTTFLVLAISLALGMGLSRGAEWKSAHGPLSTRWTRDVSPEHVLPEYPRPQLLRREWMNLNGLWEFAPAEKDQEPPFGKQLERQILVPYPVESALSGVMKPLDRVWYRRTFTVNKEWAGRRVLLHFGAVNWQATVWLNGTNLGSHRGGYDGFSLDITDALKPASRQELIVGVWNPVDAGTQPRGKQVRKPGGIFYTASSGIWQTVWLEPVAPTSIESLAIVPDVDAHKVHITVRCRGPLAGHTAAVQVFSVDNQKLVSSAADVGKIVSYSIARPRLWSPESPSLYSLFVQLRDRDQKTVDAVESYFALRKIEVGKDEHGVTRLLLNGKAYFQLGLLDQGFWPDGIYTAPTDAALRYDIEATKRLGFNLARKHVKVEPERWYYWCDKLGLLVWQDMPSGDRSVGRGKGEITRTPESGREFEQELRRMVEGRRNHPCIVMWVPFNEGWGQYDTIRITGLIKELDPSRLVECASGWNDMKAGDVHDIHMYPGPGSPEPEPKRAAVLGEFGGLGLGVDGHTWSKKTWGYRGTQDRADLTRKYERLLQRLWQLKEEPGLSAAVYTQTTDVETEANGLVTYDREVIKVDPERVAAVNRGDFSRVPQVRDVIPTSQEQRITWRYTLDRPADDWFKTDFDHSNWAFGVGGFGTKGTPGAVVRTEWKTSDIWLRRWFALPKVKTDGLLLLLHHDDDAEVYLNGVLAAKVPGYVTDYVEVPIRPEARLTLKPGINLLAVHCHQKTGGQYIDVGLVEYPR